jgi:hypothetical protein
MEKTWIGPFDFENFPVGHKAFLIKHHHNLKGWTRYELRDVPAQTNQSYADRLDGWCGTNNDVATYAKGVAEVTKIAKNGRLQVREVEGDALATFLDEAGYPELTP